MHTVLPSYTIYYFCSSHTIHVRGYQQKQQQYGGINKEQQEAKDESTRNKLIPFSIFILSVSILWKDTEEGRETVWSVFRQFL